MADKKATIYDVAKLASVSLATASRVINGIDKVAPETKQRVMDAIKQLNYKPNSIAVELASKRNTNVAIIVPELNYSYISHVVSGLMSTANEYGYDCQIYTTKGGMKDVQKVISKVLSNRPNGVAIMNDNLSEEELKEITSFDLPVVTLGVDLKTISSVTWHYKDQIFNLVKEAHERNKHICFLRVEGSGRIEQRMLNGITNYYNEILNKPFGTIIDVPDSYRETYKIISSQIKDMHDIFFVAQRDSIALAALNAALDAGKDVPGDIEVMAMLGTKYSELSRPKLSSFSLDMKGLGRAGMKILAELIEDNSKIITKKLPFTYVKRGSTM